MRQYDDHESRTDRMKVNSAGRHIVLAYRFNRGPEDAARDVCMYVGSYDW